MAGQHQGAVRRHARRAVAGGPLLVLVIAGSLGTSVQETSALLSGNTRNVQNGVSSSALYSPSGLAATNQGSSVQLSWTAAQPNNNGNGNGYVVSGTSNGASPTCPSAASAFGVFVGSSSSTSYTDSTSSLLSGTPGSYICYLVQTGYNPAGPPPWSSIPIWTSTDTLAMVAVQLAPIISGWAVCDRDGLVPPVTADWLHPTGTYIIYANISGASTVTADLGVVGSTPFASNIAVRLVRPRVPEPAGEWPRVDREITAPAPRVAPEMWCREELETARACKTPWTPYSEFVDRWRVHAA